MAMVVAGGQVVRPADAASRMDRIVPVVIVISINSIPATVVWFQRKVRPAHAGVLVAYYDPLSSEAQRPDRWSVHILHAPLDDRRNTRRDAKVRN
jgi:hypothetical protein